MVIIRLTRVGTRNRPYYRVVAIDRRDKRDGRALEQLGTYDPLSEPAAIRLATDRIEAWQAKGAQLSDAVRSLVRRARKQALVAAPAGAGAEPMSESNPSAELVAFMARGLVSDPSVVRVNVTEGGRMLELETAEDDRGRVIGRQGRVAKAMRAVLEASRHGRDVRLEIVD